MNPWPIIAGLAAVLALVLLAFLLAGAFDRSLEAWFVS